MYKVELGIDSMSYYYGLTPKQKQALVGKLKLLPDFQSKPDYWEKTYVYRSDYFQAQGVKLIVSQIKGSRWGLLVVVHPMLVLGNPDRSRLYRPEKKQEYKSIIKRVDQILSQVKAPCSVDDMKLYRCDVTENWTFDTPEVVDEYIRILKKSCLLPHYSWDKFQEKEHKARDCKVANRHSCKQFCKSAAFFAYDKTAQLEMIEAFPDALIGKRVLRLEAQLRRKAMKKWVGKDAMDSDNWAILKALGRNAEKILNWYLICNNILYTSERGIYEDTPKTAASQRYITLPEDTMKLLRQYKSWQSGERLRLGELYQDQGFVFSQDNGKPMHPDSVNDWLKKFSKRHSLPHINPHAFRHPNVKHKTQIFSTFLETFEASISPLLGVFYFLTIS